MASSRDIKKKIRSISNTAKITRTMEMVASAKSRKAQTRVESATPYATKLEGILTSLEDAGTIEHPLLEVRDTIGRTALLMITANRGLCGGYNMNVFLEAERWHRGEAGRPVDIYVAGRKGIARLKFLEIPVHESYTQFEDKPTFAEVEELADAFMVRFLAGEVDRVVVASTRYHSAANQLPAVTQLLPLGSGRDEANPHSGGETEFIFEPGRQEILQTLLPLAVKQRLFRLFLETAVSEQIARRVAMKNASDNADEMIGFYTRKYNRERQAGITAQIMEIVGGAEALR